MRPGYVARGAIPFRDALYDNEEQDGGEVQRRNAKIKSPISCAGPSAGVTAV